MLDPDATGSYEDAGEYEGKRYYQRTPDGWFLWWNGVDGWVISNEPGEAPPHSWHRYLPDIEGIYYPIPPATGEATVTEI